MGGGKPPRFGYCFIISHNINSVRLSTAVGCSVDNVTFLHTFQMVKSVRGDLFIVAPFLG